MTLALVSQSAWAGSGVYSTEADAQAACPKSEVVWVKIKRSTYYHKSQAGYGGTGGAYACVDAARKSGYREAKDDRTPTKSD